MTHGIERQPTLPTPCSSNTYEATNVARLPLTLDQARSAFRHSPVAQEAFGRGVVEHYAHLAQLGLDHHRTDAEQARWFTRARSRRIKTRLRPGESPSAGVCTTCTAMPSPKREDPFMPTWTATAASHPTPAQVKVAGTLAQGMNTARAAAEPGLSEGTIAIQMSHGSRRAGVGHRHALVHACHVTEQLPLPEPTTPPPGGVDDIETKILWSLALDGTYAEITQHCGLSHDTLKKRIQRCGRAGVPSTTLT